MFDIEAVKRVNKNATCYIRIKQIMNVIESTHMEYAQRITQHCGQPTDLLKSDDLGIKGT